MKKLWLTLTVVLLLGIAFVWLAANRSLSFTTGYYLEGENGAVFLIDGTSPIRLSDRTKGGTLGASLANGDRILVLHDGVAESYPAQTGAYGLWKLRSGRIEDIPVSVLDTLMDLGWKFDGIEQEDPLFSVNPFPTSVSWANYSEEDLLWNLAVNRDTVALSDIPHLPLLRFDSTADLAAFKNTISGVLETEHGYDEIPSFDAVTAEMDDDFFASNSLLLTYVWSGSCTWRYGVSHVALEDGTMTVYVKRIDNYEVGDCAMAGWFITMSVPEETLTGITGFDSALVQSAQ